MTKGKEVMDRSKGDPPSLPLPTQTPISSNKNIKTRVGNFVLLSILLGLFYGFQFSDFKVDHNHGHGKKRPLFGQQAEMAFLSVQSHDNILLLWFDFFFML